MKNPKLHAKLRWEYPTGGVQYFVELYFGTALLKEWDVTSRQSEIEQEPGDNWTPEDRERHEAAFVSEYVASYLKSILPL